MKTIKNIFKKHPYISSCISVLAVLILSHLFCGFEYIYPFSKYPTHSVYPSDWFNLFLALFFVFVVYVTIDSQTSNKITEISKIEKNIEQNTKNLMKANTQIDNNIKKAEQNIQNLIKSNEIITDNIQKTAFQLEKRSSIYKYPESEQYKKINEIYRPFIIALFDYEKPIIGIKINPNNPDEDLQYEIEVAKIEDDTPKKVTVLHSTFYIIKIISPAHPAGLTEKQLNKYKYSPIKKEEYYACRFHVTVDQHKCSWVLGHKLSIGSPATKGFYEFYPAGSGILEGVIPSANQVMGHNPQT